MVENVIYGHMPVSRPVLYMYVCVSRVPVMTDQFASECFATSVRKNNVTLAQNRGQLMEQLVVTAWYATISSFIRERCICSYWCITFNL